MKSTIPPPSSAKFRPSRSRVGSRGFVAIDMLVGTALTILVVGALGAIALVSELRASRDIEVNQSLRDSWSRTLAFISNEAQQAYWLRTSITDSVGYPCTGQSAPENPLVLDGPPNPANPSAPIWRVVYGVKSNADSPSGEWRGVNRLVRCGPPFERIAREDAPQEKRAEALRAAALAGNLSYTESSTETVITDQLPKISVIPCPTSTSTKPISGSCYQPFQARLFDTAAGRDRDAQVSLYLSRDSGSLYPSSSTVAPFHIQIRANRNPGFDANGNPDCITQVDSWGNQEPPNPSLCTLSFWDSTRRLNTIKEYNIPNSAGNYRINACGSSCDGPRLSSVTEMIYLKGNFDDFTKSFSATSSLPCSRKSCYLSNGVQNLQIYDGDIVVFYDRIMRI
jgi:hypothetical protein